MLLSVSEYITSAMDLSRLGALLGVKSQTIDSILYDSKGINDAAHKVLTIWSKARRDAETPVDEMKTELKEAMRSPHMRLNTAAAELSEQGLL